MSRQAIAFFLGVLLICFLAVCHAQAATVQPEIFVNSSTVGEYRVSVYLDTEGVYANTVAGSLHVPPGTHIEKIELGSSIVDFWIDQPEITLDGHVDFAGMTPGGFITGRGLLFSVLVTTDAASSGEFFVSGVQVYAHDGLGTLLESDGGTTTLSRVSDVGSDEGSVDVEPPTASIIEIVRDAALFEGDPTVVVVGLDPQTGITGYKIRYGKIGTFTSIDMPYRIPESKYHDTLYIRITDSAGNERMLMLPPVTPGTISQRLLILLGISIMVLFGLLLYWVSVIRRKK